MVVWNSGIICKTRPDPFLGITMNLHHSSKTNEPVQPRAAATLVLMRERTDGYPRPELLMVRRNSRDTFAAGAYVFPGGALEQADSAQRSMNLAHGLSPEEAKRMLESESSADKALGYFVAAIRETFEEVGVLLAKSEEGQRWYPDDADRIEAEKARIEMRDGRINFADWVAARGLRLATDDLTYFAHWVTPEGRPKRFDTRFFLAEAAPGHYVRPDQREIVGHRWLTAREALDEEKAGKIKMVSVTVKNLELLETFASTDAAISELRNRRVPLVRPKLIPLADGGERAVHPWEPEYDAL